VGGGLGIGRVQVHVQKLVPCTPMLCENVLQGVYISKCHCCKTPTVLLREVGLKYNFSYATKYGCGNNEWEDMASPSPGSAIYVLYGHADFHTVNGRQGEGGGGSANTAVIGGLAALLMVALLVLVITGLLWCRSV